MEKNNPNNLKVGDGIWVDDAWEDDAGYFHGEQAIINKIEENGELRLNWRLSTRDKESHDLILNYLDNEDKYYAENFRKMK